MRAPGHPKPMPSGMMRLAGLGVELAATVGGACLLGYWIDRHFETGPWGLVVCSLIGVVGGLYNLIRQAVHQMFLPPDKDKQDEQNQDREKPE